MTTSISERLEQSGRQVTLTGDGFEPIQQGNTLVMGTPTTVLVTTLFVSQWSCAFTAGGVDKISVLVGAMEELAPWKLEEKTEQYPWQVARIAAPRWLREHIGTLLFSPQMERAIDWVLTRACKEVFM